MDSPEVQETSIVFTCKFCLNEHVKICLSCQSRYCAIHAAKFSPNFCKDCLSNLSAITSRVPRTSTEYDLLDDKLIIRTVESRTLQLDGPDWIFYNQWISDIKEEDWLEVYQFHFLVLKMMERDNELRKVKKARRIAAATPIKLTPEAKTKKPPTAAEMQLSFEKMNIPSAVIKAMMQAAGYVYKEPANASNNGNG